MTRLAFRLFLASAALYASGCYMPWFLRPEAPSEPGLRLAAERIYRPGETVRFVVRTDGVSKALAAEVRDALGNTRAFVPLDLTNGHAAIGQTWVGQYLLLETLTQDHTISAAGHQISFRTRPTFPPRYPVVLAGAASIPHVIPWVSSGLCTALESAAPADNSRQSLLEALEQSRELTVDAQDAKLIRCIAGFLGPLRSLSTPPLPEPDVAVLDASGNVLPGLQPETFRLDTARVIFLNIPGGVEKPLQLHCRQGKWWYEPLKGVFLASGRSAALLDRRPRLTAITVLQYEVKRVEIIIEQTDDNGWLLSVEAMSPTPITGRHPLLIEALDAEGRDLPSGIRIVVARSGLARWWFIPGPETRQKAAMLRVTDLLTGIIAEHDLAGPRIPESTSTSGI